MILIGLLAFLWILMLVFMGAIIVFATVAIIVLVIVRQILIKLDKDGIKDKDKVIVLRELADMTMEEDFIEEVEGAIEFKGVYKKKYKKIKLVNKLNVKDSIKEEYEYLESYWGKRNVRIELIDNTKALFGGYHLEFREQELTELQKERNLINLIEEELKLVDVELRDKTEQFELHRVIIKMEDEEEYIKDKMVAEGKVIYVIGEGNSGKIKDRNKVGLLGYIGRWEEAGARVTIKENGEEQTIELELE